MKEESHKPSKLGRNAAGRRDKVEVGTILADTPIIRNQYPCVCGSYPRP